MSDKVNGYPESIYPTYRIIEKEILGKKHYALEKQNSFLGFVWWSKLKIAYPGIVTDILGYAWHPDRRTVEAALASEKRYAEQMYYSKLRR